MSFRDFRNIHEMIKEAVDGYPDRLAFQWILSDGSMEGVTWKEFYAQLRQAAKSLAALGVGRGAKIGILSYSCYRWVLTDLAATTIGAATVGIYHSLPAKDVRYIVSHSDSVLAFAENEAQLQKLQSVRSELPHVTKVILFKGQSNDDWVLTYEDFLKLGRDISDEQLDKLIAPVSADDPAAIVYTSGTTGVPKGAVLTHDNLTFTAESVRLSTEVKPDDVELLFLPLAHVFARTCIGVSVRCAVTTAFARSLDTLTEDLKIARPHWFASVPRVYEKVYSKIISGAEAKGGAALKIFRWACRVGDEVSDLLLAKKPIPPLTALKYAIAKKLVFSKLQEALGGRVRFCISGAAPLNPTIGKFFHAAGVVVLEGLGMTENTSFTNVNRIDNLRFGWVGLPGPGVEQKKAEDGEVLFRGRNVMREYYKMPEETAETFNEEGWLRTGDLGEIDPDGFLRITGRKKDLIITAGGKNVAPAPIEGLLATSKYINQVCVIGDRRKYLTALVTVDAENIKEYAREHGITFDGLSDLQKNPQIQRLIEQEVAEKNKDLPSYETVKKIALVDEFTIENGMLTPTLKVKRNVALERHSGLIETLYPNS